MRMGAGLTAFGAPRSRERLGLLGAIGVALVLCIPPASAGPTVAPRLIHPPYHGARVGSSPVLTRTGCSNLTLRRPVTFNATSGVGTLGVEARARGCGATSGNGAGVSDWALVYVPLHLRAGYHVITAHWRLIARAAENLTLGRCAGGNASGSWFCDQLSWSYLNAYGYVEDLTNGTQRYSTTTWSGLQVETVNLTTCMLNYGCGNYSAGANGSVFVNTTVVWSIPVTINASHAYTLVMALIYGVEAEIYARNSHIAGGRAMASLDLSAHGGRFALTSIGIR